MKIDIETQWMGKMAFEALVTGHPVVMDADKESGGDDSGPRPKALLLAGLAGCTGMDVIAILDKMRVTPDAFHLKIEAEQTEEHPKVYSLITIVYQFKGQNLPMDKLEKAVALSQEKYCGVSAMLGKAAKLIHRIELI
ncbi:MAG TPA: osmotically inducible protein C [Bacteroidales bacterium]|nr:MAG: osmotically inducible protein C [Bacteroidetes bacterium GWE2_42_24]OFY31358.1 MAG: osmotically inducible protein C [Bacteroidetes bacterium GWF2_43_11]HBZ67770.1 osmotically inducible protein C [Bacteroidales bacterium]